MGTDWVALFDKQLCDEILGLAAISLDAFVRNHWDDLDEFSIFRVASNGESTVTPLLTEQLLAQGSTFESLKVDLVHALCASKDEIRLDYWGCYAEVFGSDPLGSISDLTLFPSEPEQTFLLLRPDHVDLILQSLETHKNELRVMSEWDVVKLREWKEKCETNSRYWIAYFLDY